jgi:hypothetical protein
MKQGNGNFPFYVVKSWRPSHDLPVSNRNAHNAHLHPYWIPFANYMPYTNQTKPTLDRLAELKPKTIAPMHGSAFVGDGEQAIYDLARVMKEVLAGD